MMVPTTRLICMAPAESTPGTMSLSSRRTPGVSRGRRSRSAMPARWQAASRSTNCPSPAAATVQASTCPGAPLSGTTTTSARMKKTLSRMGAAAAAAKR